MNDDDQYHPEDIPGLILAALIVVIVVGLVIAGWSDMSAYVRGWL